MRTHRVTFHGVVLLALALAACSGKDEGEPSGSGGAPGAGGGSGGGAVLQGGSTAAGGACGAIGAECVAAGQCCDPDAICNQTDQAAERRGCQKRCSAATECDTGCCLNFQNQSFGFCTDPKWCACGAEGSLCGGSNPACCADQTCVGRDSAGTSFECRPSCTTSADCATACCIEIATGLRACLDPMYCPR